MGKLLHMHSYFRARCLEVFSKELAGHEHLADFMADELNRLKVGTAFADHMIEALYAAFEDKGIVPVSRQALRRLAVHQEPEAFGRVVRHLSNHHLMHYSQSVLILRLRLAAMDPEPGDELIDAMSEVFIVIYAMFVGCPIDPRQVGQDTRSMAGA